LSWLLGVARPGGNVTGLSSQIPDSARKRIELLREVVSGLRRLAILVNPDNSYVALEVREAQAAARTLDLEVALFEIRRAEDIAPAFEGLKGRAEALYVLPDTVLFTHRLRINTLALGARLPTMHLFREYVEASGLVSYGPNWVVQWRRAADYVDKLLRGAKPADIPVEQPTKFDLIINLTTAKALGLEIRCEPSQPVRRTFSSALNRELQIEIGYCVRPFRFPHSILRCVPADGHMVHQTARPRSCLQLIWWPINPQRQRSTGGRPVFGDAGWLACHR
jgi:ABC-type uncharacterized transport system substrate-binding protein